MNTSVELIPSVGMGATVVGYTDSEPATVVRVVSPGRVIIQRDRAVKAFKPEFVVGGLSAVCTNNSEQKWDITPDPTARMETVTRRKDGSWRLSGGKQKVVLGKRYKHYDYNF